MNNPKSSIIKPWPASPNMSENKNGKEITANGAAKMNS